MIHFINNFDVSIYYIQQQFSLFISSQLNHVTPTTLSLLFIGGIFTSLNPCLIPILSITFSYIYVNKHKQINKNFFILGITNSFIIMIIITSILNKKYHELFNTIPILSSILTIFIGLSLMKILNLSKFSTYTYQISDLFITKLLKDYTAGIILGLSSSPCSTPILITILLWLSHSENLILGIVYLNIYILGYILPLFILVNLTFHHNQLANITKLWNIIIPISGCFILGSGIFSLLDKIFT
uniref:Cytochrome c biogenesis protein transmembrane region n=1 Tax=Sebdenia flabellata TaxID=42024 RepID=A0A1C9CA08_9FLOR|nr:cytochrome c biogenesis protein transmembrane region [Sebdenia flabellata]AOM65221.1 cytochrome c biogenesis protein transmembrane region [Sebdenia flabellata]